MQIRELEDELMSATNSNSQHNNMNNMSNSSIEDSHAEETSMLRSMIREAHEASTIELNKKDEEIKQLAAKLGATSVEVRVMRNSVEQADAKIKHLIGRSERAEADVSILQASAISATQEIASLHLKLTISNEDSSNLQSKLASTIQDFEVLMAEKETNLKELTQKKLYITVEAATIRTRMEAEYKIALKGKEVEIGELQLQNEDQKKEIASLNFQMSAMQLTISNMQDTVIPSKDIEIASLPLEMIMMESINNDRVRIIEGSQKVRMYVVK